MRSGKVLNWTVLALAAFGLVLVSILLSGCGGGTTGTGGSSSDQFVGRILDSSGKPVSGATIIVAETGDSAQSAGDGTFSIETDLSADKATLLVDIGSVESRVVVDEIPAEDSVIEVVLEVEPEGDSVKLTDKKVRPKKTPSPTPARTPKPDDGDDDGEDPKPKPGDTPRPNETPRIRLADIRGEFAASDPTLLYGLRVSIQGRAEQFLVKKNGSFNFSAQAAPGMRLEAALGSDNASVLLEGAGAATERVIINLRISRDGGGKLAIQILSIQIKNQGGKVSG